jgi:hypothetical protein
MRAEKIARKVFEVTHLIEAIQLAVVVTGMSIG